MPVANFTATEILRGRNPDTQILAPVLILICLLFSVCLAGVGLNQIKRLMTRDEGPRQIVLLRPRLPSEHYFFISFSRDLKVDLFRLAETTAYGQELPD